MDKNIPTVKKYGLTPSIKSGLSSSYYILEVKQGSNTYKPGFNTKIVVSNIMIGRDIKCGFRFDESDSVVSRLHAEIYKDKEKYMLNHLSKTNQTLLNGRPVNQVYPLKSGDEIQLSNGGPIISFIVPGNNKTNSIGLSERLQLFREQALKPYRNALILISTLFVVLCVFGIVKINTLQNGNENLVEKISKLNGQIASVDDQLLKDSLIQVQQANYMKLTETQIIEMKKQNAKLYKEISEARAQYNKYKKQAESINSGFIQDVRNSGFNQEQLKPIVDPIKQKQISQVFPDVYFVKADYVTINYSDGTSKRIDLSWSGTAFMTNNGYMVTARHVVEPWNFVSNDETWLNNFSTLNVLETNYGAKIVAHLTLNNQNGSNVQFNSDDFIFDRSGDDVSEEINTSLGNKKVRDAKNNPADLAYAKSGIQNGLPFNKPLSIILQPLRDLYIVGYPWGMGSDGAPIASHTQVGSTGLQNGHIVVNQPAFDHGNSGGPVFVLEDGVFTVVGVVSAGIGTTGIIVPINYFNR